MKKEGRIEVTGKPGSRRKQLLDDLTETRPGQDQRVP